MPVATLRIVTAPPVDGIEEEALRHFQDRITALGGPRLERTADHAGAAQAGVLRVGAMDDDALLVGLKDFQKRECYLVEYESAQGRLFAGGTTPLGMVYAVSELELRLRLMNGRVYLSFPEWKSEGTQQLFEKPAIEGRGEYINIGYNFQQITPHEWAPDRWKAYIDKLVLARLNRIYFYLWIDGYTMYPGSELSKRPLNRSIHENLRGMIDYAHQRGLDVTYMYCPSYFPKDVWDAHPDYHADIEYVKHGFPAVCSSAPGAWDLMKEIARSEFEWFKGADAIQLWFYDPGGCWCEKHGCKQNQAEILARQVKEFSDVFRTFNPNARVEFNFWPMWLWEIQLKLKYRENMNRRIKEAFGEEASHITANGAPDADFTMPLIERNMGFRTGIFLFGTNPERGYPFMIPLLDWLKNTSTMLEEQGFNAVFGHRLEAWTRYPGTFIMGQFLWNPALSKESVVRRFSDWQTASSEAGARLAEAIFLLDTFTHQGANKEIGRRMAEMTHEVYAELPPPCKEDLEYFPATMDALKAIGESIGVTDPATLDALAKDFESALKESKTLATWKSDPRRNFDGFRPLLEKGWAKEPF